MTNEIKPLEILKRLFIRHYTVIILFNILSCYCVYLVFPEENILLLLLIIHISQLFYWLLIILTLWALSPGSYYNQVIAITGASLLGVFISYIVLALYLDFEIFRIFSSTLSAKYFLIMFLNAVICGGTAILTERSLTTEKKYTEEKTGRLLSEKKLVEDQLNLLQAQIEPQFLFNTMESIYHLFDTAPEKANTMQMYFIQYLRATLVKTRARITTVEQEMDLICSYLDIFRINMEERLEYEIYVDSQAKELHFPSLLIQPIIESLIKHTLKMGTEGNRIFISVKKNNGMIQVKITDPVRRFNLEETIENTLSNIKKRIESLFKNNGMVSIQNNEATGLLILIEVPHGEC